MFSLARADYRKVQEVITLFSLGLLVFSLLPCLCTGGSGAFLAGLGVLY